MISTVANTNSETSKGGPFRVMVVDDSAIIRGFLCRYLSEDPDIIVVTTANNGEVALTHLANNDIEVVVLDIEMPVMDGMTALPKMMAMQPSLRVVMASTLTRKNAEISLRAMQMGAVDYVPKPETARSVNANIDFRRELVDKVKAWASRERKKKGVALPPSLQGTTVGAAALAGAKPAGFTRPTARPSAPGFVTAAPRKIAKPDVVSLRGGVKSDVTKKDSGFVSPRSALLRRDTSPVSREPRRLGDAVKVEEVAAPSGIKLRTGSFRKPRILVVGSSTGGPQALMKFFAGFTRRPEVPVLITQHMPATFTAILAEHLKQATGWQAQEARDGMEFEPGNIYVAPGGKHMEVDKSDGVMRARLTEEPPENFCRPAVDPLFRSATKACGEYVMAVILTGMGHDGLKGSRELARTGGTLFAQDEASSVVWGMPGAVATAGLCTEVLPIDDLGSATAKRLQGGIR